MTPKEIAYQARTYPHRNIEKMISEYVNKKLIGADIKISNQYKEWCVRNTNDLSIDIGIIRQIILDECIPIEKDD